MSVIPRSKAEKVAWCSDHVAPWTANAVAIGTTAGAVTDFSTKVTAAQTKVAAQRAAYQTAEAATIEADDAVKAMANAAADIIKSVRAKAAVGGNTIYALAEIPVPATPAPVPPPGTPTDFKVSLNPNGSLKLTWKCANPAGSVGTTYQIARQVGSGQAMPLGVSGTRSFTDVTLPAGASEVVYQIQAVRSTALGIAAEFLVRLGMGAGGTLSASVTPRMAA